MNATYQQSFTLTDLHVDCHRRLKSSVLLYLIQEVSGKHASLLGADWETLAEKNLFWAIIRHRIEIIRLPEAGETVTLETWPIPTTRVAYPRATAAYDAQGNLLFRSNALWVLMDRTSRAMVLPGKSGVDVPGSLQGNELETPGSISRQTLENCTHRTVGYTALDRNGHMNNTYYLDWTDDLLPSDFHKEHPLRGININYLAEAREGQQIDLFWQKSNDGTLCVEAQTAGDTIHRVFAVSAQY